MNILANYSLVKFKHFIFTVNGTTQEAETRSPMITSGVQTCRQDR